MTSALVGCTPRRTLALLFVALALVACSGDDKRDTALTPAASATPAASPTPQVLQWRDCGARECTSVVVPLDWAHPDDGRTIDIAITRLTARGDRIGSLLVNPGGPGASGVELVRDSSSFFPDALLERFDLVGFDPRGVGDSGAIDCGDNFDSLFGVDPTPDDETERQILIGESRQFAETCGQMNAEILLFVDTVSAARDMDVIRAALGEDKLNYLGFSYGTYLGATYADLFPENVRAFVLDGAVDLSLPYEEQARQQAAGFERALNTFLAECDAEGDCAYVGDEPAAQAYDDIMAAIEREPLETDYDDRTTGPGEAVLGTIASLYDQRSWSLLEFALRDARDGDGTALIDLYDFFVERDDDGTYGGLFEANSAINCLDTPAPRDVEAYDALAATLLAESPRLGAAAGYFGLPCAYWPVPPTGAPHRIEARGAPLIIVIGTTGDPATPYAWSQSLASQLESGVLLTYDGEGHTTFGGKSACIDSAVLAYLVELIVPPEETVCD